MTAQQIDYWKLQESRRANQATEAENVTYHRNAEKIQTAMNDETKRHNMSMEAINRANLDIAARNAAVNELNARTNERLANLTALRDAEAARHNAALEGIQQRYNEASLKLTGRKIQQEWDLGELQVLSKESIANKDRISRENVAALDRWAHLLGTTGKSLTTTFVPTPTAAKPTVPQVPTKAGSGVQLPTVVNVPGTWKPSTQPALPGAVGGGVKTAATLSAASLAIPFAMVTAGLALGAYAAKHNIKPYTPTFNNGELKKGVKWYGAE